jgi:hypothetical protein
MVTAPSFYSPRFATPRAATQRLFFHFPRAAAPRPASHRAATQRNATIYLERPTMRKMFELSIETSAIVAVFRAMKSQERGNFDGLSKTVNFRVTSSTPAYISARRIVERDYGIYIGSIRGEGFYRGSGDDMADSLAPMAASMRRTAKRSIGRADLAIQHNLPQDKYLQVSERRNRASIIFSTSAAPMPASNRKRREPAPEAEKTSPFSLLSERG